MPVGDRISTRADRMASSPPETCGAIRRLVWLGTHRNKPTRTAAIATEAGAMNLMDQSDVHHAALGTGEFWRNRATIASTSAFSSGRTAGC